MLNQIMAREVGGRLLLRIEDSILPAAAEL